MDSIGENFGKLFNSPLEAGIRAVVVLEKLRPEAVDLAEMVLLDHVVVHTADLGGPPSLHPDLPGRKGELLVRRRLVEKSLDLMRRCHLVDQEIAENGVLYRASDEAAGYIELLESVYSEKLKLCADWVADQVKSTSRAADAIVNILAEADDPIPPQGLLAQLEASSIKIVRSEKEVFLRQLVARNRDRIAKLTGLGYWLRERPYAAAKYEPSSYPSGVQTRWQRIGAFAAEHLQIKGKPSEHSELGSMLLSKGILTKTRNARGDINDALNRLPDQFVYLRGHGYWLRQLPYEPAGYRVAPRAVRHKSSAARD